MIIEFISYHFMKTAIILGATGATGGLLLQHLIADNSYINIKLFLRKSTGVKHAKVQEFVGNIVDLEQFKSDFTADEVFCCIGTTKAKTKDQEQYKAIDFGIPAKAAKLAKQNNIPFFAVISAMGANAKSSIFYNKTKGEMENAVLAQNVEHTYILRPSLIKAKRNEKRLGEDLGNAVFSVLNYLMIGSLKKYRTIKAESIAYALWQLPKKKLSKNIILSDEIKEIK